jgi:hypothetical protein
MCAKPARLQQAVLTKPTLLKRKLWREITKGATLRNSRRYHVAEEDRLKTILDDKGRTLKCDL